MMKSVDQNKSSLTSMENDSFRLLILYIFETRITGFRSLNVKMKLIIFCSSATMLISMMWKKKISLIH